MGCTKQIATSLRTVHFGGNWTAVNLKETLKDINWQQATTQVHDFNTIAKLVFHIYYYIQVAIPVLKGLPLHASDKYSFDAPAINSETDWQDQLHLLWTQVEALATLIEHMPEENLWKDFSDNKYGNYYRNLHGIIEHCHYHLGQIILIKKRLLQADSPASGH